jgi:uncharacterized oxidoreductase
VKNKIKCREGVELHLFKVDQLREICIAVLEAAGTSKEEGRIVADHLVAANLYGHDSQGVMRLRLYVRMMRKMARMDDRVELMGSPGIRPGAELKILRETKAMAMLDGDWGFGQVLARKAMEMAVAKAKDCGIGFVSICNCNHIGRVGDYVEIAARREMIGIAMCNGGSSTAPHGSIDRVYATNPISVAMPASGRPVLLDMATSVVSGGKIGLAINRNEKIPLGWIIDGDGRPTTDPYDLDAGPRYSSEKTAKKKGAHLPSGGYKGSGLSLCIEIVGGILSGAGFGPESKGNGTAMIAIDIDKFTPIKEFKQEVDRLIRMVKSSRKNQGVEEILVAGEPEYQKMEKRLREGIYVEDETWEEIKQTAQELNVNIEEIVKGDAQT